MPAAREDEKEVLLSLSPDEALVFFDWLSRMNEGEELSFAHQAEQRVLWDIECDLESTLAGPFPSDYAQLLDAARERVADKPDQLP